VNDPIDFSGQVAIVTGAGGGIGRAVALELARRGARVVVNNRTRERAEAVAAEIRAAGGTALADGTKVGTGEAARAVVGLAERTFGSVEILVNNAAVSIPAPIAELTDAAVDDVLQTNVRGTLELLRAAWPGMAERRYGRILNMTSGAIWGRGGMSVYAASKGAVLALALDAGQEGRALGIHVNALFPSAFTRMTRSPSGEARARMERDFQPERVAPVAAYLVSREAAVSGMAFHAGGGLAGRIAFVGSRGHHHPALTAEAVRDHLEKIVDLTGAITIESASQAMTAYVLAVRADDR